MTSFDFPIPSDKEKIKGQKKKKKKNKENWRYFILAHTTLPSAFAETIEWKEFIPILAKSWLITCKKRKKKTKTKWQIKRKFLNSSCRVKGIVSFTRELPLWFYNKCLFTFVLYCFVFSSSFSILFLIFNFFWLLLGIMHHIAQISIPSYTY